VSWLAPLLELLSGLYQRLFPPPIDKLKSDINGWERGAIERAALRQKEEKDGTPKP
jgi:hypothetical protein